MNNQVKKKNEKLYETYISEMQEIIKKSTFEGHSEWHSDFTSQPGDSFYLTPEQFEFGLLKEILDFSDFVLSTMLIEGETEFTIQEALNVLELAQQSNIPWSFKSKILLESKFLGIAEISSRLIGKDNVNAVTFTEKEMQNIKEYFYK